MENQAVQHIDAILESPFLEWQDDTVIETLETLREKLTVAPSFSAASAQEIIDLANVLAVKWQNFDIWLCKETSALLMGHYFSAIGAAKLLVLRYYESGR